MQNFERFLCATRLVRLSPTNRSNPKIAKIMLFQAGSDTPPLLNAAFKDSEWKQEKICKGQLITGRKKLAEQLDMNENQVRSALSKLESTGEISIKATNKFSVITIKKWAEYQQNDYFFCKQTTSKAPTNRQQQNNNPPRINNKKNYNNVNNVKKGRERENIFSSSGIDPEVLRMINEA